MVIEQNDLQQTEDAKETGRIEAFSDGVFAIVITLLAIEIQPPHVGETAGELLPALLAMWPIYLGFVTSFATIGIMWINHHLLFRYIQRSNRTLMILNGLLLMCTTLLPFATVLLAEYIRHPDARIAALVYSGLFVVTAICFNILWRYASSNNRLLDKTTKPEAVKAINEQYKFGPVVYLVAFVLAIFSATASLLLCLALAIFFALPASRSVAGT